MMRAAVESDIHLEADIHAKRQRQRIRRWRVDSHSASNTISKFGSAEDPRRDDADGREDARITATT